MKLYPAGVLGLEHMLTRLLQILQLRCWKQRFKNAHIEVSCSADHCNEQRRFLMKSKIFANISKLFMLGGKHKSQPKQEKASTEAPKDQGELIDALNLPEDNPWYFAGEKAKEANFLTKVHFATGPKMMQKSGTQSHWNTNTTEQNYKPTAAGPLGQVEVWNNKYGLTTGEYEALITDEHGVPIEVQQTMDTESKLQRSKIVNAMYTNTDQEVNSLMTQEVPTDVETMDGPIELKAMSDDSQQSAP